MSTAASTDERGSRLPDTGCMVTRGIGQRSLSTRPRDTERPVVGGVPPPPPGGISSDAYARTKVSVFV
jgi:hypothetical protein